MTGIFAVATNFTAAFASVYGTKIGKWTGFGWKTSMGIWLISGLLALLVIGLELLFTKINNLSGKLPVLHLNLNLFRFSHAWNISFLWVSNRYFIIVKYFAVIMQTG